MHRIVRPVCTLLFALSLLAVGGCTESSQHTKNSVEPPANVDCGGCQWREARHVDRSDPNLGRHSLGGHAAGCLRYMPRGMNTMIETCAAVCCDG